MENLEDMMLNYLETEIEPFIQESSYRTYLMALRSSIFPEIGDLPVDCLSAELLNEVLADLVKQKSRSTVEICFSLLKRFLLHLYRSKVLEINYSDRIFLPKERRLSLDEKNANAATKHYFTKEDLEKLFYAYRYGLPTVSASTRAWLPLIILQLETFLRAGEVLSVQVKHVDFHEGILWVKNTLAKRYREGYGESYLKIPKNGHERVVPLSPLALEACWQMIIYPGQHYLFPNTDGSVRSVDNYEHAFRRILDALEIDRDMKKVDCLGRRYGLNTHALRHTGITYANSAEGANVVNTALMAGHTIHAFGSNGIGAESSYIHAVISELRKVKTPSMIFGFECDEEVYKKKKVNFFGQTPDFLL